jgi:threonine dehydratase
MSESTRTLPAWAGRPYLEKARAELPAQVVPPLLRQPADGPGLLCENLQVTGSYKVRAVCHLLNLYRRRLDAGGFGLASSGNFAVALAWAGQHYGVPVTAVMMRRSDPWKVHKVQQFGGRVVFCPDSTEERTATLLELEKEGVFVVDHLREPEVLVGHATLGLDLVQSGVPIQQVVVPASTGGLLAATAVAVKQAHPMARIIGVQPSGADAMVRSFESGQISRVAQVVTECDALTANRPGDLPWEVAREWVDEMVRVDEDDIRRAVRWLVEDAKLVVEPGGAAGLAAYQSGRIAHREATWIVLSGGNFAPTRLAQWLG